MIRTVSLLAAVLTLAGCGNPAPESDNPQQGAAPASVAASTASAVPPKCVACHSAEPGKHGIGPSLAGVVGRKAGSVPGYAYSAAMKSSGLTWDDATLDRFLESPMRVLPGTKMVFAGLSKPDERAKMIAQLKAL